MNLPDKYDILIITLSDRASRGEYKDQSGPEIQAMLSDFFRKHDWPCIIERVLIPDDSSKLGKLLEEAKDKYNIIITTGGTGIGPKDITIETVRPLLEKEIPGIMEFIRVRYGATHPAALLSRGVAGIAGKSIVYTLPGSVRAVREYLEEILKTLEHTVLMQYGIDTHGKISK
jgi:molybdenum cofactor synthesis domain-containing protein